MNKLNLLLSTLTILTLLLTPITNATLLADQVPSATYESRSSALDAYRLGACLDIPNGAANLGIYGLPPSDPIYKIVNEKIENAKTELNQATLITSSVEKELSNLIGSEIGITSITLFTSHPLGNTITNILKLFDKDLGKAIYNTFIKLPRAYFECRTHAFTAMDKIAGAAIDVASASDAQAEILLLRLGDKNDSGFTSEINTLIEYQRTANKESELSTVLQTMYANFENVFANGNTYSQTTTNTVVTAIQGAARKDETTQISKLIKLYVALKSANEALDMKDKSAKANLIEVKANYTHYEELTSKKLVDIDYIRELLETKTAQVELSNAQGQGWDEKRRIVIEKKKESEQLEKLATDMETTKAAGYMAAAINYRKQAADALAISVANLKSIEDESNEVEDKLTRRFVDDYDYAKTLLETTGDFKGKYKLQVEFDAIHDSATTDYSSKISTYLNGIRTSRKVITLLDNGAKKAKAVAELLKEVNTGIVLGKLLQNKDYVIVESELSDLIVIKSELENGTYAPTSADVEDRIESMILTATEQYSEVSDYYQAAVDLRDLNLLSQSQLVELKSYARYFDSKNLIIIRKAAGNLKTIRDKLNAIVIESDAKWEAAAKDKVADLLVIRAEPASRKIGEETQINARISLPAKRKLKTEVEVPLEKLKLFSGAQIKSITVTKSEGITLNENTNKLVFQPNLDDYSLEFTYTSKLSDFTSSIKSAVIKNNEHAEVTINAVVKSQSEYEAVWPKAFEISTVNLNINNGAKIISTPTGEQNISLRVGENKIKMTYTVADAIDWKVEQTPNGKHYKLTPLLDLDSASFTKIENTECNLKKAQINGGSQASAKAAGYSAVVTFNFKKLNTGDEQNYDLLVECDDNTTTSLTESKKDDTITLLQDTPNTPIVNTITSIDFAELSTKLNTVQNDYDKAFFTTAKSPKKYLSKLQADKLLSTGSKALVKLDKQKSKTELNAENKLLSDQVEAAITKANEAITDVKIDATVTLDDAKLRQAQFGNSETQVTLSKAIELYAQGQYAESLNLASQITNLLPESTNGAQVAQSPATGDFTGNSTKDLTLYASIGVILLALGYLALNKKKEEPKQLTIIPSNNV